MVLWSGTQISCRMENSGRVDDRLPLPETEDSSSPSSSSSSSSPSWRLDINGQFRLPETRSSHDHDQSFSFRRLLIPAPWKQRKIEKYYKQQKRLLEGFNEMETINESGNVPGSLTEDEMKQLAKSEIIAVHVSNIANIVLFIAKVYASIESRSLAVSASTLDSLLDLLSGFILWCTAPAMKKPNQYHSNWKEADATSGYYCFCFGPGYSWVADIVQTGPVEDSKKEKWMIGIMVSATVVKFFLMIHCRRFKNAIVRAYAQDHLFDVVTNTIGLVTAVLAVRLKWWIDPTGAIIIALYTINTWMRTVGENVRSLIARTAPPEFLSKLTYLVWNHHEVIKHIDTVRAYTFGSLDFVEVDIVLPEDMPVSQSHNIGETLQEKLEQLPEVELAFVHIDFESLHKPEHRIQV